jgi:hypothetical protein
MPTHLQAASGTGDASGFVGSETVSRTLVYGGNLARRHKRQCLHHHAVELDLIKHNITFANGYLHQSPQPL